MRFSHGRFGRLEVIPLPIGAAGGTGPYEQGSSSHCLDRFVATFYCVLLISFATPLCGVAAWNPGSARTLPVVLALDPVMPAVGPWNGQCVAVGLLPVVRVLVVLLPMMRAFLPLFTPTLFCVYLSLIVSEFAVKLCLILHKRKVVPWTPNVLRRSPLHLNEVGARRTFSWHPQFNAHVTRPSIPSGTQPWLGIDYKKRLVDLRNQRSENPYKFVKFEGVEERFLSQFHNDFYESVLYKTSKVTKNGPLFQHKYVVLKSLQEFNHPKVTILIHKLEEWRILPLMTFEKNWNEEIIFQFWPTLWVDQASRVLHSMTQGVHYRLDFITFSCLLGFDHEDRDAPRLSHTLLKGGTITRIR